jgi:diguanylate cyclase (GGDEF)-like protein
LSALKNTGYPTLKNIAAYSLRSLQKLRDGAMSSSTKERLAQIQELQVVGTRGATTFFRIAELAASITGAPYAAITVIDDTTRWFYSAIGIREKSTPLAGSLCSLTIEGFEPVIVENISKDKRFKDRKLKGAAIESAFPNLNFYAGVPILYDNGVAISTLFVASDSPFEISPKSVAILQGLAESVVDSFRLVESMQRLQKSALAAHAQRARLAESHRELQQSQKYTELAADLSNIGFWSYDLKTNIFQASPSLSKVCDFTTAEPTLDDLIGCFAEDSQKTFRDNIEVAIMAGERFDIQLPMMPSTYGKQRWLRTTARVDSVGGQLDRLYGCSQDVTENVQSKNNISKLAMMDTLTGAYNRRFLPIAYLKMTRNLDFAEEKVVVMLVDIDHFKFVNDTKGHDAGDEVLKEVTALLRAEVRGDDIVGRVGGDEFMILSKGPACQDIGDALSQRLLERSHKSDFLTKYSTPVTLSIGHAEVNTSEVEFAHALKEADLAVYEAKANGRNCAVAYISAMGEQTDHRDSILQQIDAALKSHDIIPVYQPKICMKTGAVIGLEALARWRNGDSGLRPPADFIEAFEDMNFCRRISERILECAIVDAARLNARRREFGRMAVNVTESQLITSKFCNHLMQLTERENVKLDQLELEVTEKALLTRMPEKIKEALKTISDMGVTISFDDFGTGYASLTHLREFDINTIKIDKSFVQSLVDDAAAQAITASLVQMANNLKIHVVAEGVECRRAEAFLKKMGCHYGQGYLYCRPVEFDALAQFLCDKESHTEARTIEATALEAEAEA